MTPATATPEFIANCDAIIFGAYRDKENQLITNASFLQSTKKSKKTKETDLGFKYNILLIRTGYIVPSDEDIELFSAIIGDPKGYTDRMTKLGFCGMVLKQHAFCKGTQIREVIAKILAIYGFNVKQIKNAVKFMVGK